ncbi:hypothetical protein BJ508DRAFT_135345 [Ascobolus immersus RN42]|uniref:Rad21/Rec8-like protein N-terminal domain-containing protein n=1 Tax=Ascobolus immersus RN42 TaxID=1160509 RepID=A0A3N4IK85_ASCIM|nr:hypothetical protein BJ508DRAFT_135345 [Ascobolus immersus RN42]
MFYSETLLSKTGPLARVWLSANLERKLSKSHILQSDIEQSVGAIVGQNQAPMALRLSGQLLLGVVRIYSRKARYLLEDCNEALMKIKMAFRPGNVDLPAGATTHSAAALTLPDTITELDLGLPDASFLLNDIGDVPFTSTAHTSRKQDITLNDDILLDDSIEQARKQDDGLDFGDDVLQWEDLNLDIGDDDAGPIQSTDKPSEEPEVGRDLMPDMTMRSSVAPELGLGGDDTMLGADKQKGSPEAEAPGDFTLGGEFDDTVVGPDVSELQMDEPMMDAPDAGAPMLNAFQRQGSDSPLSSARSSVERDLGNGAKEGDNLDVDAVNEGLRGSEEAEDNEEHEKVKRTRKRKVLVDDVTEINGKQLKVQMSDRSAILKDPIFLPRDPTMLSLMSLHKSGSFATSFFYPKNIHPDLADLLSPDFVQVMAAAKRKRGEDEALEREDGEEEPAAKKLQLDLQIDEEQQGPHKEFDADVTANRTADETLELPDDKRQSPMRFDDRSFDLTSALGNEPSGLDFQVQQHDDSRHTPQPEDASDMPPPSITSQPLSQQTRHAVHLLREKFNPDKRRSLKQVQFQDLLSAGSTTKSDATKMFFEVLVLATKDAILPEQKGAYENIIVKPKQALWDAKAEERDEQQVAEEEERRQDKEREAEAGSGRPTRQSAMGLTPRGSRTVVVSA